VVTAGGGRTRLRSNPHHQFLLAMTKNYLAISRNLIFWYVTVLVLAIGETVSQREPAWAHPTLIVPLWTGFDVLVGKGALVVFVIK